MNYKYTCATCNLFPDDCTDWKWKHNPYEDRLIPEPAKICRSLKKLHECIIFEKFCHFIGADMRESEE